MWVFINDAMFSAVENRNDETEFVVRARIKGDLDRVFPAHQAKVVESEDSDYRFRIFIDRDEFKEAMLAEIDRVDYDNFKSSVYEKWRASLYTKVWAVLFNHQEREYPRKNPLWTNYRTEGEKQT